MSTDLEVARYALRTFDTQGRWLTSVIFKRGNHWRDGTAQASCLQLVWGTLEHSFDWLHDAPAPRCTCGLYGSHTLDHLRAQYPNFTQRIVAVIAAEGNTIVGSHGLRTQYARVVAYWSPSFLILCRARCQFRDAKRYRFLPDMVTDFGLALEADPVTSPDLLHQAVGYAASALQEIEKMADDES